MLLDRFNKQPAERKEYEIDFSDWLAEDAVISSVDSSVSLLGSGDASEPTLAVEDPSIDSGAVYQYFVSGGTDRKQYKVTFLVTFSDGQIGEWEVEYRVQDT